MRKTIIAASAALALSLTASSAFAGTLVNPSVALSTYAPSQPVAITAKHTTVTPLSAHQFILRLHLPTDFGDIITADQTGNCTGLTLKVDNIVQTGPSAPTCSIFTNRSIWVWTNVPVAAGAEIEVNLDNTFFRNSATPGVKPMVRFETADGGGHEIDRASPMPTVTIIAPAPVPTMTEWAMILLTACLGGFAALTIQRRRRTV